MDIEIYKFQVYSCGCGYVSTHAGNANRHKKACGREMTNDVTEFILKDCFQCEIPDEVALKECLQREKLLIDERERNNHTVARLQNTIYRLQSSLAKMSKSIDIIDTEDDIYDTNHNGIVYFITDKDVPDRGKIGRTKNTDVKKLKTRYSTFGCPSILCYLSTDIKEDENTLKKLMRDANCMKSNTEMISNCDVARQIFYDFMTSKLSNM
jgi:hypothetical protein